jgi:hypothetical protein
MLINILWARARDRAGNACCPTGDIFEESVTDCECGKKLVIGEMLGVQPFECDWRNDVCSDVYVS